MIRFDATRSEREIVSRIAGRAFGLAIQSGDRKSHPLIEIEMDILATHLNGCRLRLGDLLAADDFNFAHDVFGIRRHLDRSTAVLGGCFMPRFAAGQ